MITIKISGGKNGGGVEIISIDEAVLRGAQNCAVLVSVAQNNQIVEQLKEKKFEKIFLLDNWLRKRRYFRPIVMVESDYKDACPFNHYTSPYPDIIEIHKKENEIFNKDKEILDIDFNICRQLELIKKMEEFELPDWSASKGKNLEYRYNYDNNWFCENSAKALYYMARILTPKTIIEVGSGYSTAAMLDINEKYFSNKIKIISIEPNAERLKSLLRPTDNIKIYEKPLQEIEVSLFEALNENDILFIDSSHISKIDSDVNYIFFEILPRLKNGVYIHFHDIFYPFMYYKEWIYKGLAYNEMYILRAFLMNNNQYSIQLFGEMLSLKYKDLIPKTLLECGNGSLWIKKN